MLMSSHRSVIEARFCSMASSLFALAERSPMNSATAWRPSAKTCSSVNSGECGSNSLLISFISASQWRARRAGFFKSMMSGMVEMNWLIVAVMAEWTGHLPILRPSFLTDLLYWPAAFSISETSRSPNMPFFQPSHASLHSLVMLQIWSIRSRSSSVSRSSLWSGDSIPKMSRPFLRAFCRECTPSTRPRRDLIISKALVTPISESLGISSSAAERRSKTPAEYDSRLASRSRFMVTLDFSSDFSVSTSISLNVSYVSWRVVSFRFSSSVVCTSNFCSTWYFSSSGWNDSSIDGHSFCSVLSVLIKAERWSRLSGLVRNVVVFDSNLS
mmetsp:Transcript_7536/g.19241  ORF Transcript_7536/g.19241 Transcript_7536/m.19241 type:complete len:328 (-) Transcript_7536:849-1832(-)